MYTPDHVCLLKLTFDVPDEMFTKTIRITPCGEKNLLWQIRIKKDTYIHTVSFDGVHKVLSEAGMDYVREKFVESRM